MPTCVVRRVRDRSLSRSRSRSRSQSPLLDAMCEELKHINQRACDLDNHAMSLKKKLLVLEAPQQSQVLKLERRLVALDGALGNLDSIATLCEHFKAEYQQ